MNEIFNRQPEEIVGGDYFFRVPWYEEIHATLYDKLNHDAQRELNSSWENRAAILGLDMSFFADAINKIATDDKPFMDIASSDSMGFAPFIIKSNPDKPCLITDINTEIMKSLRSYINTHDEISKCNITIASFDNLDMPIKDNSLDYITSIGGIASSFEMSDENRKLRLFQQSVGTEKAISEVFRVLKPGGYFVTLEMNMECDYDLQKLCHDSYEIDKLFGVYSYGEVQAVLELLREEPWHDKFVAAGFEIEVEKISYERCSLTKIMWFLHLMTRYHEIRHWEKANWYDEIKAKTIAWNLADYENDEGEYGIDLYDTNTLFILRKPN
jgi:Methylase involved in ubiquinone/menaquinone biosynthesis